MTRHLLKLTAFVMLGLLSVGYNSAHKQQSSTLTAPRNLYLHDSLLFISDSLAGIFIYDISNASAPRLLQTIPIRGNRGLAYQDSILYADSWNTLLAIRLTSDSTFRVEKTLAGSLYYHDGFIDYGYEPDDVGCSCTESGDGMVSADYAASGQGGSYSVFTVRDSFLYYVDYSTLITLDISIPSSPTEVSRQYTNWRIETLHAADKYLFLGTQQGMLIYGLANPASPVFVSSFGHAQAYDPVVVRDTLAFITLRAGNSFGRVNDELLCVSIKNIQNPYELSSLLIQTPYGLSVSDSLVYVGKGSNGFTLVNAANPDSMTIRKTWSEPAVIDFIRTGDRLYTMTLNSVIWYDVSNPENPVRISSLP